MIEQDIIKRLREFYSEFQEDPAGARRTCPFGNSGSFNDDPERQAVEDKLFNEFYVHYGECRGLCGRLGFTSQEDPGRCPCLIYGSVEAMDRLHDFLQQHKP